MLANHQGPLITLITILLYTAIAQPQCALNRIPPILPFLDFEKSIINLQEYFVGNNLTFTISPNNTYSYIHKNIECATSSVDEVGKISFSKTYISGKVHYMVVLAESNILKGNYYLYFYDVTPKQDKEVKTFFKLIMLPTEGLANCSNFEVKFNNSFADIVVDCRYTPILFTRALIFRRQDLLSNKSTNWQVVKADVFLSKHQVPQVMMVKGPGDYLVRGVFSTINSYIQIWSWSDEGRELLNVFDRSYWGLSELYIKTIQVVENYIILLEYKTGIHVYRVEPTSLLTELGVMHFQFYEFFKYDYRQNLLYICKKGKVLSTKLNFRRKSTLKDLSGEQQFNEKNQDRMIGENYQIYKYEKIRQIILTEGYLVVLGESMLNVFSLNNQRNLNKQYKGQYMLYSAQNYKSIFLSTNSGSNSISILVLKNTLNSLFLDQCQLNSPFLYLSTPPISQNISIRAISRIDQRELPCEQSITITHISNSTKQLIYPSGENVENEMLYANLPGIGYIPLQKYGVGKLLNYQIKKIDGKIDYKTSINKKQPIRCSISGSTFLNADEMSFIKSYNNLLIMQSRIDYSLRYMICSMSNANANANSLGCKEIKKEANFPIIQHIEYDLQHTSGHILQAIHFKSSDSSTNRTTIFVNSIRLLGNSDVLLSRRVCNITYQGDAYMYDISRLRIKNNALYILFPSIKQIHLYQIKGEDSCSLQPFTINAEKLLWQLFSPKDFSFNFQNGDNSPTQNYNILPVREVLYIKQFDEILVLQVFHRGELILVSLLKINNLRYTANNGVNTTVLVSYPYLMQLQPTLNRLHQYYIDDSYNCQYMREIPLYSKVIPVNDSVSVNNGKTYIKIVDTNSIVVRFYDEQTKQFILTIFTIDQLVASTTSYLQVGLLDQKTTPIIMKNLLNAGDLYYLGVKLNRGDVEAYFTCSATKSTSKPSIQLNFIQSKSSLEEYSENMTLVVKALAETKQYRIKLTISNIGNKINKGTLSPSRGTEYKAVKYIQIDDGRWFTGSIFGYNYQCNDCDSDRIKIADKIIKQSREAINISDGYFWLRGNKGQLDIVKNSSLIEVNKKKPIWPLDNDDNEVENYNYGLTVAVNEMGGNCKSSLFSSISKVLVSLCEVENDRGERYHTVSVVSGVSFKYFVIDQMVIDLQIEDDEQVRLEHLDNIIVVYSPREIIIYILSTIYSHFEILELDHLDMIDLNQQICSLKLISNRTSADQSELSILYSLLITYCSSSLRYIPFVIYLEKEQYIDDNDQERIISVPNIHMSNMQLVNFKAVLAQTHMQIPAEAQLIQVLLKLDTHMSDQNVDVYSYITVYDFFHTYKFQVFLTKVNRIISKVKLDGIYFKFGEYRAVEAQLQQFLVVKYVLSNSFATLDQMYGVFDESNYIYSSDLIKEHHIFYVYSLNSFGQNSVNNLNDIRWELTGHQIYQMNNQFLQVLNISNRLTLTIEGLADDKVSQSNTLSTHLEKNEDDQISILYTQTLLLIAYNPNSVRSVSVIIKAVDRIILTGVEVLLIVLGSIGLIILTFFIVRFGWKKWEQHQKMVELDQNYMAEEGSFDSGEEERRKHFIVADYQEGKINLSERGSVDP